MWVTFSQALGLESNRKSDCEVRPNGICADVLANEGMDLDGDHGVIPREGKGEGREQSLGRKWSMSRRRRNSMSTAGLIAPSAHGVQGKSVSGAHKRTQKSLKERESAIPTIRWGYMGPKSKDDKSEKIDSLPILVGVDGLKWKCAHMVPAKGLDAHAITMVVGEIKLSGYSRLILKSDQEPSILALLEAVKRELGEACEIIPEQSPVGEHQAKGQV